MVNNLFERVPVEYAEFMDECLQEYFPTGCEDKMQFIKDHEIHLRYSPAEDTSELWIDDKWAGTFTQRFENNRFIFEFKK